MSGYLKHKYGKHFEAFRKIVDRNFEKKEEDKTVEQVMKKEDRDGRAKPCLCGHRKGAHKKLLRDFGRTTLVTKCLVIGCECNGYFHVAPVDRLDPGPEERAS